MARKEAQEEPFDIDVDGGDKDEDFKFSFEDDEDSEEEEEGTDDSALTDDDLDDYKTQKDDARAAAEEARSAAAELRAERNQDAARGQQEQIKQERDRLSTAMTAVKAKLKAAFDDADSDAHVNLTEELADLKGRERVLAVYEDQVKSAPTKPNVHPKAQSWARANAAWFDNNTEARMAAVSYANTLESQGVTPDKDEYYSKVDVHMRRRYPELFEGEKPTKKRASPVTSGASEDRGSAPASKSSRASPKTVKLTALQVRLAKQWNIPKEKMALEVLKQQRRDGGS